MKKGDAFGFYYAEETSKLPKNRFCLFLYPK